MTKLPTCLLLDQGPCLSPALATQASRQVCSPPASGDASVVQVLPAGSLSITTGSRLNQAFL